MRNAFIEELVTLAESNNNIILVVGDLGYSVVEPFADRFPERFINAGVAEQNMMGLAAGMASEGCHVFVYSIANFPTFRCAEQIRNDVDYHNLPVTIVSVGGGLAYGNLGYSHHAIQDYGLVRMMPNMLIASPGDPQEVKACLRYLVANPQPSYFRLGKSGENSLHVTVPKVMPGEWLLLYSNQINNNCFLTTGATLSLALEWVKRKENNHFALLSLPLWGMKTKSCQPNFVSKWEKVITVEDHLYDCGFGSWLRESIEGQPDLMKKLSIKALDAKITGMVGKQEILNFEGGLF